MPTLPITANRALDVRIYSSDRSVRRSLPTRMIGGDVTWSRDRKSGMAQFSLPTSMGVSSSQSQGIKEGDCVEFRWNGSLKYRGYVTGRAHSEENPPKLKLTGMGAFYFACKQACKKNRAFPSFTNGADVAYALRQFAGDNLLGAMLPDGSGPLITTVQALAIGTNMTTITARYDIASDVLDEIDKQSGNLAVIGCDVEPNSGENRLYIKPIASLLAPTHTLAVPGRNVTSITADESTADVVNQLIVSGGTPRYPNLLHNGSFEIPQEYGDAVGSLIINGGFENGNLPGANFWTLSGGAQVHNGQGAPHDGVHAAAYSGDDFLNLQTAGAAASQSSPVTMTAGGNYTLSGYSAKKIAAQIGIAAHIDLQLLGASGNVLLDVTLSITPPDDQYSYFAVPFVAPSGVASYAIKISLDSITAYTVAPGNVQPGGIAVDEIDLYDSDQVYEDGWDLVPEGNNALVNAFNWVYDLEVAPLSGAGSYSLYANVTAQNEDKHDVQLTPPSGTYFKAIPGAQVIFSAWVKSPLNDPAPFPPDLRLMIRWYDGGNKIVGTDGETASGNLQIINALAASSDGRLDTWLYCYEQANVPGSATQGRAFLNFRSSGAALVDCMTVQDQSAPTTLQTGVYQPDGNFEMQIECDDPNLLAVYQSQFATQNPGAAVPAATPFVGSKLQFGPRADKYSNENIIDYPGALALACNHFIGSAVTQFQPTIEVVDDTDDYLPGDSINLIGADGPSLTGGQALSIEKLDCTYTTTGLFKQSIQVQKEKRDDITIITRLIDKNERMYGPGYADGSSSGGGSDASNAGAGGAGTTLPVMPNVALIGVVNGENKVFGMPDEDFTSFTLRMDLVDIFAGDDYTYDPVAEQVTCAVAPRYWIAADLYP